MSPCELTIRLERSDRTYSPGDRIDGTLLVSVERETTCRELTVELGWRLSGKKIDSVAAETSDVAFMGTWTPGTYQYPFSLPVSADVPTYQGRLFSVERMVTARANLERGSPVVNVALVWVAPQQRDEAWFDVSEQPPPPAWLVVNGFPIYFRGVRRLVEGMVRVLTGARRPAAVRLSTQVVPAATSITITVATSYATRRLRRLRVRLRGVESISSDERVRTRTVHDMTIQPTVSVGPEGTKATFDVSIPEGAPSLAVGNARVRWSVKLVRAWGTLDNSDRWYPLWVSAAESYLRELRMRSSTEVRAVASEAEIALRRRASRTNLRAALPFVFMSVGAGVPLVLILITEPSAGVIVLAGGILAVALLIVWLRREKDAMARLIRGMFYRERVKHASAERPGRPSRISRAFDVPEEVGPPPAALRVEIIKSGEYEPDPDLQRLVRTRLAGAQRAMVVRGARGLVLLMALNLATWAAGVTSGFLIFLIGLSVLVLGGSLAISPTGRPLSCYIGTAPVLVMVWIGVSIVRCIALSFTALGTGSVGDAVGAVALAAGTAVFVVRVRRGRPTASRSGLRLLVLWVFGQSSRMREIMQQLWMQWAYLGPIQYLHGPGAGRDLSRLAAYMRGGARRVIADTLPRAMAQMRRFKLLPNIFGSYSRNNSIQCTDAVWRDALDALVDTTDLVMMDLTRFGPQNQGCAYELDLLIDRLSTHRFVLIVDGTTDVDLLQQVLETSWNSMAAESPNRIPNPFPVRLFRVPLQGVPTQGLRNAMIPMNDLVHLLCEGVEYDTSANG